MEIIVLKNADDVAAMGADLVCRLLKTKPAVVLGLATGSTQLSLYRKLVEKHVSGDISFRHSSSFNH